MTSNSSLTLFVSEFEFGSFAVILTWKVVATSAKVVVQKSFVSSIETSILQRSDASLDVPVIHG